VTPIRPTPAHRQRGLALLVLLALLGITAAVLIIRISASAADTTDQDRRTAEAMGLAREALIARAATDPNRPGEFPCPDNNNSGQAPFANPCPTYIGRLPWKTLKLPDLRDGYGERLWYALSPNFGPSPAPPTLNSETAGQLTVAGLTPAGNVIAIIFSPGPAIGNEQRDAANENNVANYLEGSNAAGSPPGPPNNFNFTALQPGGTFNDRLLAITSDTLFPEVERRVAREARKCLDAFSQQLGANNRYPWAAPLTDFVNFADAPNTHSGRIAKTLSNTQTSLNPAVTWVNPIPPLSQPCFGVATWWDNWRELLFYHVSQAYEPSTGPTGTCPVDCLTVNGVGSVKVVVIVAGHAFTASPDQSTRTVNKTIAINYLEVNPSSGVDNSLMSGSYAKAPVTLAPTARFNDRLECWQESGAWPC
jgi:type II secretory pathway pseudopilin PulG